MENEKPIDGAMPADAHLAYKMPRGVSLRPGTNGVIALFCVVLIAIVWTAVFAQIDIDRQTTIDKAITQNSNLAKAFEEHTIRTIKGIDAATLFVAHEHARLGMKIDIASYIKDGYIDGRLFSNIGVSNERGDMLASSQLRPVAINIGDREYFKTHIPRDYGGLFFSKPVQSRITGDWTFPMSRRISKPDGGFGGIVSVAVNPKYFSDFYQQAELGEKGVVDLVGRDGISRARRDGTAASVGFDHKEANVMKSSRADPVGNLLTRGNADGTRRYLSYRVLQDYPLMIVVGTSQAEVLAPHTQRKQQYVWAAVMVCLFIVLMGWLLMLAVTRQQRATDALARLNAELETRVASRTAELEAANRELNSFSYTIAHDLRAPVRAIGGFSAIVLEDNENKLDKTTVGYLRRVVAGAEQLARLIDDLLNMARLSRQEMRRQEQSFSDLAAHAVQSLVVAYPQRVVDISIQPGITINGDPGLMRVLLDNLIGNAWKYSGKTSAAQIAIGVENHNGQSVYFVRDNGAGFDMQYVHKLFAPFQRLHHRDEFDGTGIGLATVKKILDRHGGRIWLESAVNAGTTVFFTVGRAG